MNISPQTDLFKAVEQQINLGCHDPIEITDRIRRAYDDEWLAAQLLAYADDVIADIARHRLNMIRRRDEGGENPLLVPLTPTPLGDDDPPDDNRPEIQRERALLLDSKWVPEKNEQGRWAGGYWKRLADFKVDDCLNVAAHYHGLARANERRGFLYERYADQIRKEKVDRLGEVKHLPKLSEIEEEAA